MRIRSKASAPQAALVNSAAPYPAFVGGYGSGKSHALMLRALKLIFDPGEKTNVAYYLPTYDLVKQIAYPRIAEMLNNLAVPYSVNKSDHTFEVNNKRLIMRTLDNPERIVGYEVGDSLVDELDTLPTAKARDCWSRIIARNRQKKRSGKNTVAVGTTPEGYRFVYEKWGKNPTESYELIKASTYSNKHIPTDYVELLRETYPSQLLNAYIDGEFVNLTSGTVYSNYDRTRCRTLEDIQPGDHILSDLPQEERNRICHEAYQHLINRKSSVELLASTDDNSEPAGGVGNEDFDWEEDCASPVLVIRRAWVREIDVGSSGSRGADDGSGGRTG